MKHQAPQFELHIGDSRPREFVTKDSAAYLRTLADLDQQGAVVESIGTVSGHHGWWRITCRWPAPTGTP